jgi:succinate dehydrogenase / fumarate reductase cytochrome b subunit
MIDKSKPLSPHLQIYKPQITSITSILHRLTGVALYFGVVMLSILISYYTYQTDILGNEYKCDCLYTKIFMYAVAFIWSFALYYHLANGIRHLFWDIGKGFDIVTARKTGIIVLLVSFFLTIVSFYLIINLTY